MFTSILCPIDPAEKGTEQPALASARLLAEASGAKVTLIAVIQDAPGLALEYLPPNFREEQIKEANGVLDACAAALNLPAGRASTKIRLGRPGPEILDEAKTHDLIVMASHQPSLSTYFIGSTAAQVVRHAPCSVMVIRPPAP